MPASPPENLSTAGCGTAISGFLYTSFTNCSPQTGQNPVSLKHKEAASRKVPRRDNSSLSNRHSSISPLFSLFLSRKAAGSHAGGFSKNVHLLVGRTTDPFFNGGCCLGRAAGQGQRRRQLHQHIASKHQRHCHREKLADAAARPCSTATARIFLGAKPNPAIWSFIRMIPTSASLEAQTQTAIC